VNQEKEKTLVQQQKKQAAAAHSSQYLKDMSWLRR